MATEAEVTAISKQLVSQGAAQLPAQESHRNLPATREAAELARAERTRGERREAPEPATMVPGFTFSDAINAGAAHWQNGVRYVAALQTQLAVAANQLPDLEAVSPTAAIKRRAELEQQHRELMANVERVVAFGQQVHAAAVNEIRAAVIRLIPEWETQDTAAREVAAMLDHARALGLTEQAIDSLAWNPIGIMRFREAWLKTKHLTSERVKPFRRREEREPRQNANGGGAGVDRGKLNALAQQLRRSGTI